MQLLGARSRSNPDYKLVASLPALLVAVRIYSFLLEWLPLCRFCSAFFGPLSGGFLPRSLCSSSATHLWRQKLQNEKKNNYGNARCAVSPITGSVRYLLRLPAFLRRCLFPRVLLFLRFTLVGLRRLLPALWRAGSLLSICSPLHSLLRCRCRVLPRVLWGLLRL